MDVPVDADGAVASNLDQRIAVLERDANPVVRVLREELIERLGIDDVVQGSSSCAAVSVAVASASTTRRLIESL